MAEPTCPRCNAPISAGSPTCPACGLDLSASGRGTATARHSGIVPLVIGIIGLLMIVGVVLVAGGVGSSDDSGGEIFLEAAASPGQSPFTAPLDPEPAPTTTTTPVSASPIAVTQPTSGVVPPPGSPPYGGSGDDQVCDREALITFLTTNPAQAQAWAGVLGVAVADIPAYVRSLTPTVLLYDTRVTNHGFAGGRATSLQSVLQAGTAVLVDPAGNPVVRCRCGNPLQPPAQVSRPVLQGTPWPGFDPSTVVAVDNGATVTVVITVVSSPAPSTTQAPAAPAGSADSTTTTTPTDATAIDGLLATVAECSGGAPVEVVDVLPAPELGPTTVTAQLVVNGVPMLFTYDPTTGAIGEGDRASAEFLATCGVPR